ncbi:MAG: hypothetical protein P8M70_08325, partial [Verrucomicrobiota bacterium]|nr:hypothetical protein [Verrucomicrobiota bacterium]
MADTGFRFDNTYLHLPKVFYTMLLPEPMPNPEMVILNVPFASDMGLDFSGLSTDDQAILFAGNQMPEGSDPMSQAYAGHQFGH